MAHKYVYLFSEGNGSMRELLGGKGANLAEMTSKSKEVNIFFSSLSFVVLVFCFCEDSITPGSEENGQEILKKF